MDLRWEILAGYGPLFLNGLWMTIQLTIVSIGAGLLLGVLLGLVSSSRDAPAPKSAPLAWALKAARAITVGYVAFFLQSILTWRPLARALPRLRAGRRSTWRRSGRSCRRP